jgi:hypothetical protein
MQRERNTARSLNCVIRASVHKRAAVKGWN